MVLTLHLGPGSINDDRSVALRIEGRDFLSSPLPPSLPSPPLSLFRVCPVITSMMKTSSSSPESINSAGSGDSVWPRPLMGALISCLISLGAVTIDAALSVLPIPLLPSAVKEEGAKKDKCTQLTDVLAHL